MTGRARLHGIAMALVLGVSAPVIAAFGQSSPAPASSVAPIGLDELGRLDCPPGLERFLPGVYYYCVGARDLADHREARGVEMLKLAAAWGSKPAQFTLGVGYFNGDIVAQDRAQGLAWLGLAAERRDPGYQAVLRSALARSTAAEQAQANALWRSMRPRYGDAHAATRAERRYRHERNQLLAGEPYGRRACIAGLTQREVTPVPPPTDVQQVSDFQYSIGCPGGEPASRLVHLLDGFAGSLFEGLDGHVTVGPLTPASPDEVR